MSDEDFKPEVENEEQPPAPPVARSNGSNGRAPFERPQRQEGRVAPHNLEAEEALLGAMLLSRDACAAAADRGLDAADFYRPAHGHIYDTAIGLYNAGEPVDPTTVAGELHRADLLDMVGGPAGIVGISARTPATSSAGHYAKVVADHALLRRLIGVAGEIAEVGYSMPDDVAAAVDHAEELLYALTGQVTTAGTARYLRDALDDHLTLLEARADGTVGLGVPSGLRDLDEIIGGALPGQMLTIAGRPGMGKTGVGLAFAGGAAKAGHETLFVSIEMGEPELMDRLLASESQVDQTSLRHGRLAANDWARVSHAVGRLAELPLVLYDDPAATVARIANRARRIRGLGLIVVDYLQLLVTAGRSESRRVEVDVLARGIKRLARELNVPVVPLAQLNRNLESRADKRPMLSDLRESGGIEQDSDVVIGLYREEVYKPDTSQRGILEMLVLKQRNGPLGVAKVGYKPETQRLTNLTKGDL